MNPLLNASGATIAAVLTVASALVLLACGAPDSGGGVARPIASYDARALVAGRADKDAALRQDESPIPDSIRGSFPGLSYFAPNPALAFEAPLEVFGNPTVAKIPATGGDVRMMTRYGRFTFEVDGKRCYLTVFKSDAESPHLFIPFRDATNGAETYEVGRYIDLEEHEGEEPYLLDFNLSYNPYCAYNESYTCPIVPLENTLPVEIRAGERLPGWGAAH